MLIDGGYVNSILCGTPEQVGASRALAEFRSGRPAIITGADRTLLCLPAEGLKKNRLAAFRALAAPVTPRLVLTSSRARSLGIDTSEPVAVELGDEVDARTVLALVAENGIYFDFVPAPVSAAAAAAIDLVKLAKLLPAVLVADTDPAVAAALSPRIITVDAKAVARFRKGATQTLAIAGEAHVPLSSGVRARISRSVASACSSFSACAPRG